MAGVKDEGRQTNQLWKAHMQASSLVKDIRRIGEALAENDAPPELLAELRVIYKTMTEASTKLTDAYQTYGGRV